MNIRSWANKKILVVEDDEISKEFFEEVLKPTEAILFFAKEGKAAIEIYRANPDIDIILMDIQLPVMDGQQAADEIRKINKNVVIIAQTAYAMSDDRQKYLSSGFDDYISKPINPNGLLEMIDNYLL
jgi:two-component system cell cycle response regulator DivK